MHFTCAHQCTQNAERQTASRCHCHGHNHVCSVCLSVTQYAARNTDHAASLQVLAAVAALRAKYEDSTAKKAALEVELADLEAKLERAERLVTGLAGERARWEASIASLEAQLGRLPVHPFAFLAAP